MNNLNFSESKSIDELVDSNQQSDQRQFKALFGYNLGSPTFKVSMSIGDFIDFSDVANPKNIEKIDDLKDEHVAQRNLDPNHATGLALYVLKGLVISRVHRMKQQNIEVPQEVYAIIEQITEAPFCALQPVVVNIRNTKGLGTQELQADGDGTGYYNLTLSKKNNRMFIVDGQHRSAGFERILVFLNDIIRRGNYSKGGLFKPIDFDQHSHFSEKMLQFWTDVRQIAIMDSTLCVECHIGLEEEKEQQLFFDLNRFGKTVSKSLSYRMDHADSINNFVRNVLIEENILTFEPTDMDQNHWDRDTGAMSRKDVNNITSIMALGTTNSKKAVPYDINRKKQYMINLWRAFLSVPGFGKPLAKKQTVLAQPVVMKGVAALSYSLAWGHSKIKNEKHYEILLDAIKSQKIDFSHDNKLWRCLFMDAAERDQFFPGLNDILVLTSDYKPDYGLYDVQNKVVRFGSRHSDIFPKVGDMLRWTLGFPPRPTKVRGKL